MSCVPVDRSAEIRRTRRCELRWCVRGRAQLACAEYHGPEHGREMTSRHAAAFALLGWYLMTPPPQLDPNTHLPNGNPDLGAPYKYWRNEGSFDSAKECKIERESDIELHRQIDAKIRREHRSEQQETALELKMDETYHAPKGWSHGMRDFGMTAAISAECISSDDTRLKGD
jgi:hypothetical protein